MKYYLEDEMKDIRTAFEDEVLSWPKVTTKKMFGCPCYQVNKKLFVFIVTGGVVVTKLNEDDREQLVSKFAAEPFQAGTRTATKWPRVPVEDNAELKEIFSFVKKSYDTALNE